MNIKGIRLKYEGKCQKYVPQDCGCLEIYNPVCGIDNITYDNHCKMRCKGMQMSSFGVC